MSVSQRGGRAWWRATFVAALVVLAGLGPSASGEHEPGWQLLAHDVLWDGVELRIVQEPGPVRVHVIHVHPNAPVRIKPVVSGGRLGSDREVVSSMCARLGALGCVNANYSICSRCDTPHGAVVRKFQFLQSPTEHQSQLSLVHGRFRTDPIEWSAQLEAVRDGPPDVLRIDAVNTGARRDQIVLHNRHFGRSTGSPPGTVELVVRTPVPLWAGGVRQQAELLRLQTDGDARIPHDGAVLSGSGAGAHALWAYAQTNARVPVDLLVRAPARMELAVSGHPVLLVDGSPTALDPADRKVTDLHPRTLVGWDEQGSVWFVVVDGRQAHSRGMTLAGAQDLLLRLGARHAVNLDGGGSSTMVSSCAIGWCVRNRPSDGGERRVGIGLAIVPPERW